MHWAFRIFWVFLRIVGLWTNSRCCWSRFTRWNWIVSIEFLFTTIEIPFVFPRFLAFRGSPATGLALLVAAASWDGGCEYKGWWRPWRAWWLWRLRWLRWSWRPQLQLCRLSVYITGSLYFLQLPSTGFSSKEFWPETPKIGFWPRSSEILWMI